MIKKLFLLLFLIFAADLFCQTRWLQTYRPFETPYADDEYYVEDLLILQDGCFLVSGYYEVYNEWLYEKWGFLMKTDPDGNFIWAVDDSVSYISYNMNSAVVETTRGDLLSISYGGGGGALIKRNSYGERIWHLPYGDFGINSMELTESGDIIAAGLDDNQASVRLLDTNGNTIWNRVIGDAVQSSNFFSVCQTSDGGFAMTGTYHFAQGYGNSDAYLAKTDSHGDTLWTRRFDGFGNDDMGKSIIENSNGNIVVLVRSSVIYNSYTFLLAYNPEGDPLQIENIGIMNCFSIIENSDHNYVAYAYTGSTNLTRLILLDDEFNIIWNRQLPFWPGSGDRTFAEEESGGYICCGDHNYGEGPIYLALTDPEGNVQTDEDHTVPVSQIKISNYPNPFNPSDAGRSSSTRICFNQPVENGVIRIYNLKGQLIRTIDNITGNNVLFDGKDDFHNDLNSGIYLYRLSNANYNSSIKKMILLK